MGVSINRGTPKWMIYMENRIEMDDLGVPLFSETSIYYSRRTKKQLKILGIPDLSIVFRFHETILRR